MRAAEGVLASGWLTSFAVERQSFGRWVSRLSGRNRHQSHTPSDELADTGPGGQPCRGVNDAAFWQIAFQESLQSHRTRQDPKALVVAEGSHAHAPLAFPQIDLETSAFRTEATERPGDRCEDEGPS